MFLFFYSVEQADFFLENGYVVIKQAFTKEVAAEFSRNLWVRLALDPQDKSTWDRERIHMPFHRRVPVSEIAPKVSSADPIVDQTEVESDEGMGCNAGSSRRRRAY